MSVTGAMIHAALGKVGAAGGQIRSYDELAAGANDALRKVPGLTKEGAAGMLATAGVEGAWFRTTTEYGDLTHEAFYPWIGRTFIQLTWEDAYAGFGAWCEALDLVADPNQFVHSRESLSDYRWAWLGVTYYLQVHDLWRYANAGNFLALSQAVNGGAKRVGTSFTPNSWTERQALYTAFLSFGDALLPAAAPSRKALPRMIDRPFPAGDSDHRIICPTGSMSAIVSASWFSASCLGNARVRVWAQRYGPNGVPAGSGPADQSTRDWTFAAGERPSFGLPDGTEFLTVQVRGATAAGALLVEMAAK